MKPARYRKTRTPGSRRRPNRGSCRSRWPSARRNRSRRYPRPGPGAHRDERLTAEPLTSNSGSQHVWQGWHSPWCRVYSVAAVSQTVHPRSGVSASASMRLSTAATRVVRSGAPTPPVLENLDGGVRVRQTAGDVEVNDAGKLTARRFLGCGRWGDLVGAFRPRLDLAPGDDHRASKCLPGPGRAPVRARGSWSRGRCESGARVRPACQLPGPSGFG